LIIFSIYNKQANVAKAAKEQAFNANEIMQRAIDEIK
jgi:hypothetical protein